MSEAPGVKAMRRRGTTVDMAFKRARELEAEENEREPPKEGTKDWEVRKQAEGDFYYFLTDVLKMDRRRFSERPRKDDVDLYEPLHGEMGRFLSEIEESAQTYHCLLVPRGHLKTTLVVGYVCWRILRDPDLRILLVNGKEMFAIQSLDLVKQYLESDRVKELWPDVVWEKPGSEAPAWKTQQIVVKRKIHDRVPTVFATGLTAGLASMHYHLIILDDIVNEENYKTPEMRQSVRDARGTIEFLLRGGGHLLNVGTRWHYDDAHQDMVDGAGFEGEAPKGPFEGQVRLLHKSCYGEDGEPIFPTYWTHARLAERKKRTTAKLWACQMLNRPELGDDAIFRESDFLWFDLDNRGKVPTNKALRFYTAVDPNRSEKTQHDPCVVMTAAKDSDGEVWVVDITRGHPSLPEMVDWIRAHVRRWGSSTVIVETNNYQLQICGELRRDQIRSNVLYSIQEANRGPNARKFDRISAMEVPVRNKAFHIRRGLDQLALEMKNYPSSKNDDCLDALADVWQYGVPPQPYDQRGPEPPKSPFLGRSILEQLKTRGSSPRVAARRA